MEREKEIIKASVDYNADKGKLRVIGGDAILSDEEFIAINQNISFIDGVKWADQHPRKGLVDIEKACKKLEKCMYDNLMFQGRLHRKEVIETFIGDFKKYLEE